MTTNPPAAAWPKSPRLWRGTALVVVATALAYAPSLFSPGEFLYHDIDAIRDNPHIQTLWPLDQAISLPLWNTPSPLAGRPVLSLSFALNTILIGPEPVGFRAVNLAIHAAAALLLLGVLRRALASEPLAGRGRYLAQWLPTAAAVLWAVHPLQTAGVTYALQRAESLMGLMLLLTLYCAVRGFTAPGRPWPWYLAAVVACWIGQGVNETLVAAPLLVLLYDWQLAAGSLGRALRRRWGLYLALAATWGIAAALLALAPGLRPDVRQELLWQHPLAQPLVIARYLGLAFWPDKLVLARESPIAAPLWQQAAAATAALAILTTTFIALCRRRPWALPAAAAFLILVPASCFPLAQPAEGEHRMYLPLAGAIVLALAALYRLILQGAHRHWISPGIAGATMALLIPALAVALGWRTCTRNNDYRNELAIWSANVRDCPESGVGQARYAAALMRLSQRQADDLDPRAARTRRDAIAHFRLALPYDAGYQTCDNLAELLQADGDRRGAMEYLQKALKDPKMPAPRRALVHARLAALLYAADDEPAARYHYERAMALGSNDVSTMNSLAWLLATSPRADVRDGPRALQLAQEVCRRTGHRNAAALMVLAAARAEVGEFQAAATIQQQAIVLMDPDLPGALEEAQERLALYLANRPYRLGSPEPAPASGPVKTP